MLEKGSLKKNGVMKKFSDVDIKSLLVLCLKKEFENAPYVRLGNSVPGSRVADNALLVLQYKRTVTNAVVEIVHLATGNSEDEQYKIVYTNNKPLSFFKEVIEPKGKQLCYYLLLLRYARRIFNGK